MPTRFVGPELLSAAITSLGDWAGEVPKQMRPHVWSVLPPKLKGAAPGKAITYAESDDRDFMERFLKFGDEANPYFDPFKREFLHATFPHSNTATARKNRFDRVWHGLTWSDDVLTLADNYGEVFVQKVLTKAGKVTRIPAIACAVWFFKRASDEWSGSSWDDSGLPESPAELVARFRSAFGFDDDPAWVLIFDPSVDYIPNYSDLAADGPLQALSRAEVSAICEALAIPEGGLKTAQEPNTFETISFEQIESQLDSEQLDFPADLVKRVAAALTHSHVRLLGPPGTGKTSLTRAILEAAVPDNYVFTVATGQWTGDDVVGGPMPDEAEPTKLAFRPGIVIEAADQGKWVAIDEINRADIDVAFGELFGLLAGFDINLPYAAKPGSPNRVRIYAERPAGQLDEGEYGLPKSWRMIATMNSWDKLSLNRVSFAFSRRWCSVFVPVPEPTVYSKILTQFVSQYLKDPPAGVVESLSFMFVSAGENQESPSLRDIGMAMGPGIARSCVRDVAATLDAGLTAPEAVSQALDGFVLPQFEGALEQHEDLVKCVRHALGISGAGNSLLDEVDSKLAVFTGRRVSTKY